MIELNINAKKPKQNYLMNIYLLEKWDLYQPLKLLKFGNILKHDETQNPKQNKLL